jgi:hypothetical protein
MQHTYRADTGGRTGVGAGWPSAEASTLESSLVVVLVRLSAAGDAEIPVTVDSSSVERTAWWIRSRADVPREWPAARPQTGSARRVAGCSLTSHERQRTALLDRAASI